MKARRGPALVLLLAGLCLLAVAAWPANRASVPAVSAGAQGDLLPDQATSADPLAWNETGTNGGEAAAPQITTGATDGRAASVAEHDPVDLDLDARKVAGSLRGATGRPIAVEVVSRQQSPPVDKLPAAVIDDRPLTDEEIAELTAALAKDLDAYWAGAFAAEGRYYSRPSYVLVEGTTPTPCAWDGAVEAGAGSFYCPWNQTIYLDLTTLQAEDGRYGAAGVVFTLAHEWGHHAQFQRGDLQERSRAVELAADCLSGAYLADAVARGQIPAEVVEDDLRGILTTLGDPRGLDPADAQAHGTGGQRAAMLLAGYTGGLAACD